MKTNDFVFIDFIIVCVAICSTRVGLARVRMHQIDSVFQNVLGENPQTRIEGSDLDGP